METRYLAEQIILADVTIPAKEVVVINQSKGIVFFRDQTLNVAHDEMRKLLKASVGSQVVNN